MKILKPQILDIRTDRRGIELVYKRTSKRLGWDDIIEVSSIVQGSFGPNIIVLSIATGDDGFQIPETEVRYPEIVEALDRHLPIAPDWHAKAVSEPGPVVLFRRSAPADTE